MEVQTPTADAVINKGRGQELGLRGRNNMTRGEFRCISLGVLKTGKAKQMTWIANSSTHLKAKVLAPEVSGVTSCWGEEGRQGAEEAHYDKFLGPALNTCAYPRRYGMIPARQWKSTKDRNMAALMSGRAGSNGSANRRRGANQGYRPPLACSKYSFLLQEAAKQASTPGVPGSSDPSAATRRAAQRLRSDTHELVQACLLVRLCASLTSPSPPQPIHTRLPFHNAPRKQSQ
eukprot:1156484-Pelagomonas_calceolata.AAC.10